jgi:pyruvate dehydrogenase E1 component
MLRRHALVTASSVRTSIRAACKRRSPPAGKRNTAEACRARERGLIHARSHVERLFAGLPPHCGIVSVLDGHPATLAWLGAVYGHKVRPLGVEHFGQTGTIPDLYRHYGIDANAVIAAAQALTPGAPILHLKAI